LQRARLNLLSWRISFHGTLQATQIHKSTCSKASQVPKYLGAPDLDEVVEMKQDIKIMTSRASSRVSKVLTPTLTVARAV
jgi:hypothetical protein